MSYLVFKDQKSFMNYFRQEPSSETAELYKRLCDEEFAELEEAWKEHLRQPSEGSVTEIADACLDLIYVATGLIHALGLDPQPLWDEVHRSNVEKIKHPCLSCEATGTVVYIDDQERRSQQPCSACKGQGFVYEVRRREDGKVLKPGGWTPPQLLPLVQGMVRPREPQA